MLKTLLLFLFCFPALLSAQHGFIKLDDQRHLFPDKFFAVGTKLKVKERNGEKTVGILDTVFADAFVVGADTIMFDSVKHFSWKNYPTKKAKRQFWIGAIGTGVGVIGTAMLAITSVSHDQSMENVGGIAGSIGIPALLISPFFLVEGYVKIYAWHGKHVGKAWKMSGILG